MASQAAELIGITRNPVPLGAVCGTFTTRDGLSIRYARWDTTAPSRLGTVCLFGGRTDFIEKYFETIADLRRRGFAVATMDWRGQGGSSRLLSNPEKGHAENFAHHDSDVRTFMSEIVLPDCPPPFYCLAHSMGGASGFAADANAGVLVGQDGSRLADDPVCRQRQPQRVYWPEGGGRCNFRVWRCLHSGMEELRASTRILSMATP